MHQRKAEMARHSDCFIALPGPIFLPFCSHQTQHWAFLFSLWSMLLFRWIWNFGGVVRSNHMGSTGYPWQACMCCKQTQICKNPIFWLNNLSTFCVHCNDMSRWVYWMLMVIITIFSLSLTKPLMMALSSLLSATSLSQHQTPKNLFKNLRWGCLVSLFFFSFSFFHQTVV